MAKIIIKSPARIAGDVYEVADIVGKTLFPRITVDYYSNVPSRGGVKLGIIKAGYPAGTVISWVQDPVSKTIWWQFNDKGYYYIEHQAGRFNVSNLKQQGVLTVAEKIEEEKKKQEEDNKSIFDKFGEGLSSTATTGLWILGGAIVVISLLKK